MGSLMAWIQLKKDPELEDMTTQIPKLKKQRGKKDREKPKQNVKGL